MSSALAKSAAPALVESEFHFTREDFVRVAAMLYEDAGITLSDSKATLVYSRLAKRIRTLGLRDFDAYCRLVASPGGTDERGRMLNALTTNLTRFFREPHHFDHLREKVLEPMVDRLRSGGRLRIWSAGCSSGQEPFSIALTILSVIPEAAELDVRVLATDIDSNMIAHGRAATYTDELLEPVPQAQRAKWMERDPADRSQWRFGDAARSLVAFKELNLMSSWPVKGPFDAIFCRNVVIYFDEPTQEKVWTRFNPLLVPGGRLYIGHSERLGGASSGYVSDGMTAYRSQAPGLPGARR
ncbi:MAG: protein-glutamate O-methyltransferase [Caulobacter sp.]|nr:protein-glutamate O-methyltransferase [Caulobacter sp.]